LDDKLSAEIVLLAIVSGVVFPTVFKLLCPRPKDAEPAPDEESQKGG
jgi:hypothetical protein